VAAISLFRVVSYNGSKQDEGGVLMTTGSYGKSYSYLPFLIFLILILLILGSVGY